MANINIAVVDDHKIVRDGIRSMLDEQPGYEIIAEAGNGKEIIRLCESQEFDIIIMDITMPEMDGIEAARVLTKKYPQTKILALTMLNKDQHIRNMINAGASGYVLKSTGRQELLKALNALINNQYYFSDDATKSILSELVNPNIVSAQYSEEVHITDREREVLQLIVDEFTNQEIADHLHISVRTVDAHRRNLLQKIGAKNTAGLVKYALEHDILNGE